MINLDAKSHKLLQAILKQHIPNHTVWLFGSRATAHCKPYSDIDLAIISSQPISDTTLALLATACSESDLPYKVDIIDFASASKAFQDIIQRHYVVLQTN